MKQVKHSRHLAPPQRSQPRALLTNLESRRRMKLREAPPRAQYVRLNYVCEEPNDNHPGKATRQRWKSSTNEADAELRTEKVVYHSIEREPVRDGTHRKASAPLRVASTATIHRHEDRRFLEVRPWSAEKGSGNARSGSGPSRSLCFSVTQRE